MTPNKGQQQHIDCPTLVCRKSKRLMESPRVEGANIPKGKRRKDSAPTSAAPASGAQAGLEEAALQHAGLQRSMSKSPSGTRVRLVCTSCKTLCEVFIPGLGPSTKAVRYQVRCPNCKAINEPQNLNGSVKAADPKRKVCLTAPCP